MSPGGLWVLDDELEKGGWKQVICGEYEFCLGTRVKVWVTCITLLVFVVFMVQYII